MNGAGTGIGRTYQATREAQAWIRALSAVNAVVLGTTTTTRGLPAGIPTTTRTTAAAAMASALSALQSNIC